MLHDPKREAEIESEIRIAKEPHRKVWLDAARLLREKGHCHGRLMDGRGARCALGAIYAVEPSSDAIGRSIASTAAILLGKYVGMPVAIWNDANSTETVIATLELLARAE